jgi:murein DD-endopeptidase MepM/ murein hydrolase activator NlpD
MVRISHYSQSYGNVVVVRHANGLETLYAHMEARFVQPGQWVQNGDVVGLGGNTGRSYGAHLHFEIRYLGHAINPALILNVPKGYILQEDFIMSEKTFTKANTEKDEFSNEVRKSKTYKGRKYHTVRRGETLSSIARRHGTTVAKMAKLNKIRPSAKLRVGQKLRVK